MPPAPVPAYSVRVACPSIVSDTISVEGSPSLMLVKLVPLSPLRNTPTLVPA